MPYFGHIEDIHGFWWGRPGGQEVWLAGHTLPPKILGFSPKFPYKLLNSLLPLILEIWKENFEKGKL
jgi:hypothetical protein